MQTMSADATVITNTLESPYAMHRAVPVGNVRLRYNVLASRMETNFRETIPSQYRQLVESGRLRNFERAIGKVDGEFEGRYFNDSDVYKWLEGACWAIVGRPEAETKDLRQMIDSVVGLITAAQRDDGYVNTYFAKERENERWTNLQDKHELYCAGHLIQAAIAHTRVTGSDDLLQVAVRFADHICEVFGPASEGKREQTDGHEEIELALIELYRETGNENYLNQAAFFIDIRGHGTIGGRDYHQDATPLRQQREMVGHAVRAVYLNAGAADLVAETGDRELYRALQAMMQNMLSRRSYVTGGIGSRYDEESFGEDYELPNNRAYTETCAAIGVVMWMWRMLQLKAVDNTRIPDIMERVIYNAVLPGVSLDGQMYFYQNPLRDDGNHRREPWFTTACCPPNIARFLAQLPGYFTTVSSHRVGESDSQHDVVWMHLYAEGEITVPLQEGGSVTFSITTRYPWESHVRLEVTDIKDAGDFTVQLRIPDWATGARGRVNGEGLTDAEMAPGQYMTMTRVWMVGDVVELYLPMPVRRIVSHPRVANNTGRVALMRGPLVYCIEAADNPVGDVRDLVLTDATQVIAARRPDLLDDVVVLSAHVDCESPAPEWEDALYRNLDSLDDDHAGRSEVQITAIPYMVWANRGAGPMTVWLRRE